MPDKEIEKRSMRYVVIRCVIPSVTSRVALEVEETLREAVTDIPNVTVDVSMSNAREVRGPRI